MVVDIEFFFGVPHRAILISSTNILSLPTSWEWQRTTHLQVVLRPLREPSIARCPAEPTPSSILSDQVKRILVILEYVYPLRAISRFLLSEGTMWCVRVIHVVFLSTRLNDVEHDVFHW